MTARAPTDLPRPQASRALWLLALAWGSLGCEEEQPARPTLGVYTPPTQDPTFTPEPDPTPYTPPLEDACGEGQLRCLATDSPEILRCLSRPAASGRAARRWVPDQCDPGQVCRQGACAPLRCTPGEALCASPQELGICAPDGAQVQGAAPCPAGTACRGGACVDLCDSASRARSYLGCEYMVAFLPNVSHTVGGQAHPGPALPSDGPFALVVANPEPLLPAVIDVDGPDGAAAQVLGEVEVSLNLDVPDTGAPVQVRSSLQDSLGAKRPAEGPARGLVIPPGGVATLLLDLPMLPRGLSSVTPQGWRLRSTVPVAAYQFNPYCCNYTFTNDASILLPTSALGSRYRVAGAPAWNGFPTAVVAVASQPDTRVTVRLPQGAALLNPIPPAQPDAQGVVQVTLQAGEVLSLQDAQADLTGAVVEADKPLAVFSSHQCTFIPHGSEACDHLEEQLIPEDTWGQTYVLSRPVRRSDARSEVTYWRLLAGEAGAKVRVPANLYRLGLRAPFAQGMGSCLYRMAEGQSTDEDQTLLELAPGEDCTMGLWSPTVLYADAPISVVGFVSGQDAGSIVAEGVSIGSRGDPSMFLLAPVEQFRAQYTFLTPETYERDHVTITTLRGAAGALTLDGAPLDPSAQGVVVEELQGSDHLLLHVPLDDGAHTLEGTAPFGILVYAYDDYVSYAYTGGLNLLKR